MHVVSRGGSKPGTTCHYNVEKLWEVTRYAPVQSVAITETLLTMPAWTDVSETVITPLMVERDIDNPRFAHHKEAIEAADLRYPIIMNAELTDCYDGLHRIVKAHMLGHARINAVSVTDAQLQSALIECTGPVTVHISGSPGSGKSTLGEHLKAKLGDSIAVYDTDEFFQDTERAASGYETASDSEKELIRDRYFEEGFETALWDACEKSVVVFVGLLDHASPSGRLYNKQPFDYKYFIDIPVSQLIKQYYQRVARELDSDEFLQAVTLPGNTSAIPDSDKLYTWHMQTVAQHLGYQLIPSGDIEQAIEAQVKSFAQ